MNVAEVRTAWRRARARRDRRRARRGVRRDRAPHPRAAGTRPLRGNEVHDGASRGVVPSRDAAARARAASSRPRSATGRPKRRSSRAKDGSRATPGPTRTRSCARRSTRSGGVSAAPTACSSTRTSMSTARRRRAVGVGFYGKNTMLITRRHGSWVVLGTLVTDVELEPTPPLDADCGACTLCIDACPTGALDEPGTLDATKCLSYWTQAPELDPGAVPRGARRAGLRLRHLPGRLPVEPRRAAASRRDAEPDARPRRPGRVARGRRPGARRCIRPAVRAAQRPALAAAERARRARERRRRGARAGARAVGGRRRRDARRARRDGRSPASGSASDAGRAASKRGSRSSGWSRSRSRCSRSRRRRTCRRATETIAWILVGDPRRRGGVLFARRALRRDALVQRRRDGVRLLDPRVRSSSCSPSRSARRRGSCC